MRKLSRKQTDKLFREQAEFLYDRFCESAIVTYTSMFPEEFDTSDSADYYYDMIRERLMVELQVLYMTARGEKNVKNKCKKATAKRTAAK